MYNNGLTGKLKQSNERNLHFKEKKLSGLGRISGLGSRFLRYLVTLVDVQAFAKSLPHVGWWQDVTGRAIGSRAIGSRYIKLTISKKFVDNHEAHTSHPHLGPVRFTCRVLFKWAL
jgi:hypothetical protein